MAESLSQSNNLSLSALYDLEAYFGSRNIKTKDENEESEEQKKRTHSATTRKVLKELQSNMNTEKNSDALYDNEKSPFLSEEYTSAERQLPFMTLDSERPNAFFTTEQLNANTPKEQITYKRPENYSKSGINNSVTLSKNKDSILAELRRSAMSSTMTARDIAKKYGISYMQAQEIFVALNENKNGIVKEFKLPQNATVSFLV